MPSALKKLTKIAHLSPDERNANRGTVRGGEVIQASLEELGAGRSILADRSGRIIAGNKTVEAAKRAGIREIVVVQTDGKKIVVVQRTDLDLRTDPRAKKLAIADNRAGELSLDWDNEVLALLSKEVDLGSLFDADELSRLLTEASADFQPGDAEDQPALDKDARHTCPKCGHTFKG